MGNRGNPNIGKLGKKFSTDYQPSPEKRGRPKGRRNRKALLETLIATRLSTENLAIAQLKKEFPEFFEHTEEVTIEDIMLLRMAREAIFAKRPLQAINGILDRLDGKPTIKVSRDDEVPVIDYEERERKKLEMLKRAEESRKQREENEQKDTAIH